MKILSIIILATLSWNIIAQTDTTKQGDSGQDLAQKIQNPIANLVSLPFQNNTDFNDKNSNTLNIQPVTPFNLGSKVNLIVRTIIPIISAPTIPSGERATGCGGIILSSFLTPAKPSKFIWGIGPAIQFPTIKKGLGSEKTSLAPGLVVLYQNNGWTFGGLFQNFWSIAGPPSAEAVNFFYSQIFITKNLPKGWYVNTAPIITTSWKDANQYLTLPLGAGFGKLFKLGKLPVNAQIGYYQFVKHPLDATGQLRVQVSFILPKFYAKKK